MAKVQIVAGRRVPVAKPTLKQVEKSHKTPVVRVKNTLSGLSLKQLLKATPPYLRANSEEVIVKSLKPAKTKAGLPGIRSKVQSVTKKVRNVYDVTIIGKEKDIPVSVQKHVLVSCSCPFFCYHSEVALHHWGSALIKYSNGEHPEVTNPGLHPLLCKHLYKLAATVVQEGL
jgi:hypothetical protein